MKSICVSASLLAAILLTSSRVFADERNWSTADTYRQATVIALTVADWSQTRHIVRNPCARGGGGTSCTDPFRENGLARPFIGSRPSVGSVNSYFAASIITSAVISYVLPSKWRTRYQYVEIGIEAGFVHRNYIGIKYGF